MLLTLAHTLQTLLAGYTGLYSYSSIRKVQTYEETSQKLAKYSNTVEHHLKTTQSTMAAGAISVLTSILSSLYLLSTTSANKNLSGAVLSVGLAVGVTVAHSHVSNYWRGKAKVPAPGAGDYNDAITTSNVMRSCLAALAASWAVTGLVYLVALVF